LYERNGIAADGIHNPGSSFSKLFFGEISLVVMLILGNAGTRYQQDEQK
jgi:hypothetical protein